MSEINLTAYQAAHSGAAYAVIPEAGCLRIEGEDRQAFLQRQTTNDVRGLAPERAVLTVLTSSTARTLDVLYLLPEETAIAALTLPGRAPATGQFLRSRIFFMDKVSLVDASPASVQIDLFGPRAPQVLERLGAATPEVDQVVDVPWQALTLRVLRLQPAFGLGFRLLAAQEALQPLCQALAQAGAAALDAATLEVLRIEAGLPAGGAELSETYTPLEAGLKPAISSTKGCYTGQEVIARQITYDKVTQHLAGLRLEAPVEPGVRVYTSEGDLAGTVTSAALSPRLGALALAVLKRPHHAPGTALRVGGADGQPALVAALPFE